MVTISLGILTKNVEDSIEPLLEQCASYAHEIIILDSFSTDKTVEIAKRYGARVYEKAFTGSYAELRNFLLNVSTGEYLLMLDADETLEDVHRVFNGNYTDNAYAFPRYNYVDYAESFDTYPDYQTRLIKRNAGVFYNRDIHEIVSGAVTQLDTHIIHDKHNFDVTCSIYDALHSYVKYKTSSWLEVIDIMNNTYTEGWYTAERFANGDMARWCSSHAAMILTCNDPAAQALEFKISTFGEYERIVIELQKESNEVINSIEINTAGVYRIPFIASQLESNVIYLMVRGYNKIKEIGDSRDLCAFFDYAVFTADYKDGYMKLLWDESEKFYMKGFTYDVAIMECIVKSGWWETDNLALMKQFINADDVCIDVGANIGSLTIPMATLAKQVYAFEAGPEIYGMLKSNLIANDIQNVEALNVAVSNKKDTVYFHHNTGNVGGSYVTATKDEHVTASVDAIRFDTWAKQALQRLDFVKCDIEGFEVKFLKGAKQTFKKYKPKLLIEFNPVAFNNNSTDDTAQDLWDELRAQYEYIYVVEGPNNFRLVESYNDACARIDGTKRTLEDLLCLHDKL